MEERIGLAERRERETAVLERLVQWAWKQDAIRAMLFYSSRVTPNAPIDRFSDYDVLLAVRDVPAFYTKDHWLEDFGSLLVVFRNPLYEQEGFPASLFVTHYEDGVKVDFAFVETGYLGWMAQQSRLPEDFDYGYEVLLDKDGLTTSLPEPTFSAYRLVPPDAPTFIALLHEFFNDAAYVAKALKRGDLLPVKLSLDHVMKYECLLKMLDWHWGVQTDWKVASRAHGKGLPQRMNPAWYAELERTYVGAGEAENWEALWATIRLFRKVALEVAAGLGMDYPHDLERRVMTYLEHVQADRLP